MKKKENYRVKREEERKVFRFPYVGKKDLSYLEVRNQYRLS